MCVVSFCFVCFSFFLSFVFVFSWFFFFFFFHGLLYRLCEGATLQFTLISQYALSLLHVFAFIVCFDFSVLFHFMQSSCYTFIVVLFHRLL